MFKHIPISRMILYLISVGLLPLIFLMFLFISNQHELQDLHATIEYIQHQAFLKEKKQAVNLAVCQYFAGADHFYIDKYLETLVFLEPEVEILQKMIDDKNFAGDERVKKRLEFLTSSSNALTFSEGVVQAFPLFQETLETLIHPVEVNGSDIQKILACIEGIKIGDSVPGLCRPQLLVTEFRLDKKKMNDKHEVYLLDLKLIKREFL
jgi:hypothetical protein